MEIPASIPKSDEVVECLRTDKILADAIRKADESRTAYYEQKIMESLMDW